MPYVCFPFVFIAIQSVGLFRVWTIVASLRGVADVCFYFMEWERDASPEYQVPYPLLNNKYVLAVLD